MKKIFNHQRMQLHSSRVQEIIFLAISLPLRSAAFAFYRSGFLTQDFEGSEMLVSEKKSCLSVLLDLIDNNDRAAFELQLGEVCQSGLSVFFAAFVAFFC